MLRRDLLKSLTTLPFVGEVQPLTEKTKVIIISLQETAMKEGAQVDTDNLLKMMDDVLREAGCPHIRVVLLTGFDVHLVQGE